MGEESYDFLLSDEEQILEIHAWDEDKGALRSDDDLGVAKVTIKDILINREKDFEVELLNKENIGTGAFVTIRCDVAKLKVDPNSFDNMQHLAQNHAAGLLTIVVTKAFDLPLSKEEAESFVR